MRWVDHRRRSLASIQFWKRYNTLGDRSPLNHKVNLFDLHHKYADVMHVEKVVAHLEGLAKSRAA